MLERLRDARVDDDQPSARLSSEDVRRGTAGGEVRDHLGRHLARIRRHPLGGDAVVARGDDDRGFEPLGDEAADPRELAAELLQPPEAAARLRLRVVAARRLLERVHASLNTRPATTKHASSAASAQIAFTRPSTSR